MTISVTIQGDSPAELHAKMLGLIGHDRSVAKNSKEPDVRPVPPPVDKSASAPTEEPVTAEVVPLAEKRKPATKAKKAETVIDAEPATPEPAKPVTSEDARKALDKVKDIAGLEAAREISKKHEPGVKLGDKSAASWAAIIQACETFIAAAKE